MTPVETAQQLLDGEWRHARAALDACREERWAHFAAEVAPPRPLLGGRLHHRRCLSLAQASFEQPVSAELALVPLWACSTEDGESNEWVAVHGVARAGEPMGVLEVGPFIAVEDASPRADARGPLRLAESPLLRPLGTLAMLRFVAAYELLLLPGLDGTGSLYAEFERALPENVRLRALAYPPDRALGYADLADWVRERLPQSGPWLLLGESFSGPLALRLAAERPPGLVGLVLVATFHAKPLALPPWLVPTLAFRVTPPRWLIRRLMFDQGAPEADLDHFLRALASVQPEVMARRAREALRVDETASLATIDVPMLYLRAGADGLFSPKVHAALKRVMPELETKVIADAPHLVLQRRPRESAEMIARWCAQLES